ncbi:MAG: sodium:dicarboxylate symporter family protein [Candidatus Midichloriaceae bacterium]|jgi:Na+/H+-dicarboxylate symporter|nr:sodium:dicarboxylate symporter family protein [Candidatus Midichloriaceae bacterium]
MLSKYKLPFILLALILLPMAFGSHIPLYIKSFFYSLSLSIKDILVTLLPIIIFSFLFNSLISLKQRAILFIILLLIMVATSNFIAITIGYAVGSSFLPFLDLNLQVQQDSSSLTPLWDFIIPKLISNEPAIILGIILGIYFALNPNVTVEKAAQKLNNLASTFLKKVFLPILPLFILGFILKLEHDGSLSKVFNTYGSVLMLVVSTQVCYITFVYFIASGFNFMKTLHYIKHMLPATLTGFSTISSAATIPVNIMCTEKNLRNPSFAKMVIPATANIHTLGSAIGLTILSLATLLAFGHGLPSSINFFIFAFYYTMAKFAVAGIPGGVVLVVSPLLETYLGFNAEMIGLITAIYLMFDPFGTATNVTCNGAFAIIFNKVYKSQESIQVVEEAKEIA